MLSFQTVNLLKGFDRISELRWPTQKQVAYIAVGYRRTLQLDRNQLIAAQKLQNRNPVEFFL